MQINPNFIEFVSTGYMQLKVPDSIFDPLKEEIINMPFDQQYSAGKRLAGNIRNEFMLTDNFKNDEEFNNFIKLVSEVYNDKHHLVRHDAVFEIDEVWVNFQKKYEFNPNHDHTGLLSFVIWLQIPYELSKELNQSGVDSNCNVGSCFEFSFMDPLGKMRHHALKIDKSWEGQMVIFPSQLTHCVYPFITSDDYRISIAGNVKAIIDEKRDI